MGSLMKIILILTTISAVLCTTFINHLQEGQEWNLGSLVKKAKPENEEHSKVINGDLKLTEEATEEDKVDAAVTEAEIVSDKDTIEEPEKVDYSGYQVWKISTNTSSARNVINKLALKNVIEQWGGNRTTIDLMVKPEEIENVRNVLKSKNIPYAIMIEDLQKNINEENPPLEESDIELQNRQGHRMTWKRYHALHEIYEYMDYLATAYPLIASVYTIGKSYEEQNLKVLRISNGRRYNKAVFIDGGIHAREWISPAVVTYFMYQFAENYDYESEDIKNIDWYFMPVFNPDGYVYSYTSDRFWRKNRRYGIGALTCTGIDLNRNFGYKWGGKGSSMVPCSQNYRGISAFSEPETYAFEEYFRNYQDSRDGPFYAYLSYHSYGQYILYPWSYDDSVPSDHIDLKIVGDEMARAIEESGGSVYKVGPSSETVYSASGNSIDWAKSQSVKYTYTIELGDTGSHGFVLPASYIEDVAEENLAGLRVLAHYVNSE